MLRKVVINSEYGGFGLSKEAQDMYCAAKGFAPGEWNQAYWFYENFHERELDRDDPILVDVVEQLGEKSWGKFSVLKIVEIPADIEWSIHEYDGIEWVAEAHRTWS